MMAALYRAAISAASLAAAVVVLRRLWVARQEKHCAAVARTDTGWLVALNDLRSLASYKNAVRGNCAAIIVKDGRILTWGYARSLVNGKRERSKATDRTDLHAEADAITAAALNGVALQGSTLYCTIVCCRACFRLVAAAGIERIVTPPAPNQGYIHSNVVPSAEIASSFHIEVCDDAELPPYAPVSDRSFLPHLTRRIPRGAF
jgi:deoxycytidylate deaminase